MSDPTQPAAPARFAIVGLIAWALASAALRLVPSQAIRLAAPLAAALLIVAVMGLAMLARMMVRPLAPAQRPLAMTAFVLPGMLGDAVTTAFYRALFPNLPPGGAGGFGALMLLGYAVMLAAALFPRPRHGEVSA